MAIRLRLINGVWIAICAARSVEKEGDVYLDDGQHHALGDKFARDFDEMFELGLHTPQPTDTLVEQEESNNPNRNWWDSEYVVVEA
jgi:hypothetical protein